MAVTFVRADFSYDKDHDLPICPDGKESGNSCSVPAAPIGVDQSRALRTYVYETIYSAATAPAKDFS